MTRSMIARPGCAGTFKSPARQQVELALAYLALLVVVCTMVLAGLGALARPFYMLAAAGFAWFTLRRSPWLYISATLWFWLMTAFIRRFIEWRTGFNPTDIILATPNLMMLFMLRPILTSPGLLRRRELGPGLAVAAAVIYGICVSFFRGEVVSGAVAAADWLAPTFYFFFVVAHTNDAGSLEPHFRTFLPLILGVTVPYGLYQYFYLPAWDAQWMIESQMGSIGKALPMELRVFGTTNNPAIPGALDRGLFAAGAVSPQQGHDRAGAGCGFSADYLASARSLWLGDLGTPRYDGAGARAGIQAAAVSSGSSGHAVHRPRRREPDCLRSRHCTLGEHAGA